MLLPPDLIYRAYRTLDVSNLRVCATARTCKLLKPPSDVPCLNCPARHLEADSCGFKYTTNPNLKASMDAFYELYPEYLI